MHPLFERDPHNTIPPQEEDTVMPITTTIAIPLSLRTQVRERAVQEDRTLNDMYAHMLAEYLKTPLPEHCADSLVDELRQQKQSSVTIRIDQAQHNALRRRAASENRSVLAVFALLIADYLKTPLPVYEPGHPH